MARVSSRAARRSRPARCSSNSRSRAVCTYTEASDRGLDEAGVDGGEDIRSAGIRRQHIDRPQELLARPPPQNSCGIVRGDPRLDHIEQAPVACTAVHSLAHGPFRFSFALSPFREDVTKNGSKRLWVTLGSIDSQGVFSSRVVWPGAIPIDDSHGWRSAIELGDLVVASRRISRGADGPAGHRRPSGRIQRGDMAPPRPPIGRAIGSIGKPRNDGIVTAAIVTIGRSPVSRSLSRRRCLRSCGRRCFGTNTGAARGVGGARAAIVETARAHPSLFG